LEFPPPGESAALRVEGGELNVSAKYLETQTGEIWVEMNSRLMSCKVGSTCVVALWFCKPNGIVDVSWQLLITLLICKRKSRYQPCLDNLCILYVMGGAM
jgi:hypothetical protein